MSEAAPSHVVVVLNWFGRDDTLACVDSLRAGSPEADVLVVDNGSFDGAVEALSGRERVHTLQLERNLGFAGGMNRGLEWALERGAATITVLNNDTVIPDGAMLRLQERSSGSVAVSPTVLYRDRPDEVWFGGGAVDMPAAYPHHVAVADLEPCVDGARPSEILAGCCITASRETWQRTGLFDERFFLNFEDSEWSLRARAKGVSLVVACDTVILHAVSASFRRSAESLGGYYFVRNGLLFSRIAGGSRLQRLYFLRRFTLGGIRQLTWTERGRRLVISAASIGAYLFHGWGEAPQWLQRRTRRWAARRRETPDPDQAESAQEA